jgi:MYXO-CTERM domain-containing protein
MRLMNSHSIAATLALAVLLPSAIASAQPFHFEDSLRDGTTGNASGGSFGPEGWTVTAVDDAIWYALPTLESGYVEFTVANITLDVLPLGDHEIFAMYEAGYGIGEPIEYSPDFRQNHYKVLMRIYGTPEPGRAGSMKLMWGMCPDGAPGWYSAGCICDEGTFDEPFADPGPWTGAPVRLRVEWADGHSRLLRDGVEVLEIDWSGSGLVFGPEELHMMIGSPRNDGGLSAMPMGARFSDLVVDGQMGPVETCGSTTPPDAGVPFDAGSCATGGLAIADGTAASWITGVYPDAGDLNVEGDGATPSGVVYMRFPAVGAAVSSATVTLTTATTPSAGGGSGQICRVDGGTFDEATLTWSTRPAVSTACTGGARAVSAGEVISFDVTSLITSSGEPTFALVSTDGDGAHFLSRESGGCAGGPRLDVVLAPGADGGPGSDSGPRPDGAGIDSGSSPVDSGRAVDAGRDRGGISAGCGCRVGTGAPAPGLALVLAAIAIVVTARRRARRLQPRCG